MSIQTVTKHYFAVETVWPSRTDGEFNDYNAHGFTDRRDPGAGREKWLVNTQPAIFGYDLRTSRDLLHFKEEWAAQAAAAFIREYGRMTVGWEGAEAWRKDYRKPILARVVEVTITHTRRVIE